MKQASARIDGRNRVASILLFVAVAAAPLPYGSVDLAAIAFWCIVLGVAVASASIRGLKSHQAALLGIVGFVLAAYALVLHEQSSSDSWLGTPPDPIWQTAQSLLGARISPSISIAPHQPFFALGGPLLALLSLVAGAIVCADRQRAQRLLQVVAWSGTFYAVLGIAAFLIDPTRVLWREKVAYQDSMTGSFINRNTAAVYFGACSTVCLLLLMQRIASTPPNGTRLDRSTALMRLIGWPFWVFDAAPLLSCVTAMLMTRSRAGVVFSLAGMVVAYSGYAWRSMNRRSGFLMAAATAGVTALGLLQIVGSGIGNRFDQSGLADVARLETYRSTLRIIADHPWLGTGLGTFPMSFPPYRSASVPIWGVWDRAHDTLLEIASEGGLPLAGLVAACWIAILVVLANGIRIRRRALAIPVAAFAVAIISILHSAVDFSLQIPGYCIVIFALVGAGVAQSFSSQDRRRPVRIDSEPGVEPKSFKCAILVNTAWVRRWLKRGREGLARALIP